MARPDLSEEALLEAMRAADAEAVVALFDGATDKDRARVRPAVEKVLASLRGMPRSTFVDRLHCAAVALFACCSPTKIREEQRRLDADSVPPELLVRAVTGRTARFREALAKSLLGDQWGSWHVVRTLVRAGAIDPAVDDDAYVRLMMLRIDGEGFYAAKDGKAGSSAYDLLLEDPGLLEREVWRIFEVPDAVGGNVGPGGLLDALVRCAGDGRLDRQRLLDACGAALATDFRQGALRWFAALWDQLSPTDDELAARQDRLLGLLASPESAVSKLALDASRRLDAAGRLDTGTAAEMLRAPLAGPRKHVAMAALGIVDQLVSRAPGPEERDMLLGVAASALGHPRSDVAERALDLIGRLAQPPGEALRMELLGWVDAAPATLRAAVAELAGVPGVAAVAEPRLRPADVGPATQPGPEAGLTEDRRLAPVEDLDELVGLFAAALEGEGGADDVERALAAVLSGAWRPSAAAVSPIRKRALQRIEEPATPLTTSVRLAGVVLAWTDQRLVTYPGPRGGQQPRLAGRFSLRRVVDPELPATPGWFLQGRLVEVMRAVAKGRPAQALAEPTHSGGRLDPRALEERLAGRAANGLGPYDRRLAGLRTTDGRWSASTLRLEVSPQPRPHPEMRASPNALGFVPAHQGAPADPLIDATVGYFGLQGRDRYRAGLFGAGWDLHDALGTRLGIATFAARPDVPAAWGAAAVTERNQQAMSLGFDPLPMVEALADAAVPLTGAATTLLALALVSSTQLRAAAVDVTVAAVDDGRFDPAALARDTAALHRGELVVLTRLSQPVADLAASGPRHLLRAQQFLLALVAVLPGRPSGLHGPLETLAQLSAGGIDVPDDARRALADLAKASSKAGKAAATVLTNAVPA